MRSIKKLGFTLVELLVVIAIIGMLVGLLLPAINAAREAGRRTQCLNKLHQLGLAFLAYSDANGVLPAGSSKAYLIESTPIRGREPFNQNVAVLPFLEFNSLYDKFNFGVPPADAPNLTIATEVVPQFLCPSWNGPAICYCRCTNYPDVPYAMVSCYMGNAGPLLIHGDGNYPAACPCSEEDSPQTNGRPVCYCAQTTDHQNSRPYSQTAPYCNQDIAIFYAEVPYGTALNKITDGQSMTLLEGEQLPDRTLHSSLYNLNGSTATTNVPLDADMSFCPLISAQSSLSNDDLHNQNEVQNCDGFKSMHPQACNFVMCDGSTHSFNVAIDYVLFNHMGTKAGGELVVVPEE